MISFPRDKKAKAGEVLLSPLETENSIVAKPPNVCEEIKVQEVWFGTPNKDLITLNVGISSVNSLEQESSIIQTGKSTVTFDLWQNQKNLNIVLNSVFKYKLSQAMSLLRELICVKTNNSSFSLKHINIKIENHGQHNKK